jgi:hypothetical protein
MLWNLALVAAVVNGGVEEESEEDHDEGNDDDELLGQDCVGRYTSSPATQYNASIVAS